MVGTNRKGNEMTEQVDVLVAIAKFNDTVLSDSKDSKELQAQRKRLTDSIYQTVDSWERPSVEHIAEVTVAMNRDIQLRDFMMGLPSERPIDSVVEYLTYFDELVPLEYAAPIASIMASNFYSLEQTGEARELLNKALASNPSYSLANLLNRVFNAGWPSAAFVAMTHELHPKVKEEMGI